jgi:mannose/cellobiose epimerase-like protein (N-acyl-D-glucosamine 2-epimerase family)
MLLALPPTTPDLPEPDYNLDPAHEAYGHAAALLAAAQALEASTRAAGAAPATAPALACIETSLEALSLTVESLRAHALERLEDPWDSTEVQRARRARVAADLARLAGTLEQAAAATAPARGAVARIANELADP